MSVFWQKLDLAPRQLNGIFDPFATIPNSLDRSREIYRMSFITVMCPKTGDLISTGIEIDAGSFAGSPTTVFRTRCQACGSEHAWSKGRAWLAEGSDRLVRGGHFGKDVVARQKRQRGP
jgi:hypothetical protein